MFSKLTATVIFVHDLEKCSQFYKDMLGLPVSFTDDVSIGFKMEDHDFLLLKLSAAAQMITEAAVSLDKGHRMLLCIGVDNVDASYEVLTAKGLMFIKPPKSQAWGRRTAYFADPEGNLWELWHELPTDET